MRLETSKSSSAHHPSEKGMLFGLGVVIVLIVCGAAFGIVRMQRGLDTIYQPFAAAGPFAPDQSGGVPVAQGPAQNLPQIIIVGNPKHGQELFNMSCFVCHGPTGAGVPNLGANLRQSKFIRTRSDQQLITFVKIGRLPGDPNTLFNGTMPPKGGNPTLDDAGIQDVVAFLRTLQQAAESGVATSSASGVSSGLH